MLETLGYAAYYYLAILILVAIFYMVFMVDRDSKDDGSDENGDDQNESNQ